jgi:hypothetical protein
MTKRIKLTLFNNKDYGEWIVKWWENGKWVESKSYYTDDKGDAISTMKHMRIEADQEMNEDSANARLMGSRKQLLLTKAIERKLPALYATDGLPPEQKIVQVKFFTPDSNWTWYGIEYDPQDRVFFGLVQGFEEELGYFSLDELESTTGPMGLSIERDKWFRPQPLSEIMGS